MYRRRKKKRIFRSAIQRHAHGFRIFQIFSGHLRARILRVKSIKKKQAMFQWAFDCVTCVSHLRRSTSFHKIARTKNITRILAPWQLARLLNKFCRAKLVKLIKFSICNINVTYLSLQNENFCDNEKNKCGKNLFFFSLLFCSCIVRYKFKSSNPLARMINTRNS